MEGKILSIQLQLAECLGFVPEKKINLPALKLRRHWIQLLLGFHRRLDKRVRRVLRAATRSPEYAIPPQLSVLWGADCANRTLYIYEKVIHDNPNPRKAVETATEWAIKGLNLDKCLLVSKDANEAIKAAEPYSKKATYAAYAAREALDAIPGAWSLNAERWLISDYAAVHAGHAAMFA